MKETETQNNKREIIKNTVWIGTTLVAIYLFARFIGLDATKERVLQAGIWGPVIIMILKASTLVIAPLGGSPLYPIAGVVFGFWKGFLYTFLGDFIGTAIAFFISRRFGRRVAQYFVSKPGMLIVDQILHYLGTTRGIIQARLIFFSFPEGVTYAAGLTTIPFWKYLILMIPIGIWPHALLVGFGSVFASYVSQHPYVIMGVYMIMVVVMGSGGYWFIQRAKTFSDGDEKDG